jgi:hypothetical protein
MRWTQAVPQDERRRPRTAKSYCPDAPRQASSSRKNFREATESKKPGLRGDYEGNRNTIARGMPECFGLPVVTVLVCFHFSHTRLRVRLIHPAFPAPFVVEGQHNSGEARRENVGPCADEWRFPYLWRSSQANDGKTGKSCHFRTLGLERRHVRSPRTPGGLLWMQNGPRCGL